MSDCRPIIKEAMRVVCDLHSHDDDILINQDHLFNSLLRPRLPYEVRRELKLCDELRLAIATVKADTLKI